MTRVAVVGAGAAGLAAAHAAARAGAHVTLYERHGPVLLAYALSLLKTVPHPKTSCTRYS